jgi:hypothetical protein
MFIWQSVPISYRPKAVVNCIDSDTNFYTLTKTSSPSFGVVPWVFADKIVKQLLNSWTSRDLYGIVDCPCYIISRHDNRWDPKFNTLVQFFVDRPDSQCLVIGKYLKKIE